ncbi:pseudouridine synthase [Nitratireductor sp. CAU 1489]|uniref:Pseudouridine synthase n=1 Tax=Nitratireductor arenosus TaxID=2682096 RepID=A0A844QND7_9HYPH|nr:pseudouridine synthase [Nitratireductor arenosus]MVA99568.1 pseudouridine synthase [Nitratireductor arenosus]
MSKDDKPGRGPRGQDRKPAAGGDRAGAKPGFAKRAKTFGRGAPEVEREAGERIAKRLARAGIASRREAEMLIAAGRVAVNGRVLDSPAINVGPADRIDLDGTPIPAVERTRLFLFHKPAGLVTTNRDPEGRETIFDALPKDLPRLITVGRLDINTEGLLLLTNDGGLARTLELPATGWLRRYRVRVHGAVDEARLKSLADGIAVDGVFYGSIDATLERQQGSNAWLSIGLREGKNREVKNVLGSLGLEVTRLIRISFGPFQLADLAEGAVLEVKGKTLRDQLGERLIEEAGANFDAPVVTPFSNSPVAASPARPARDQVAQGERRRREPLEPGEGGLIKSKRRSREDRREGALSRLDTKPQRKDFGAKKTAEPRRARSANVWMAPGARPPGKAKADDQTEPARERKGARGEAPRKPYARPDRERSEGRGEAPRKPYARPDRDKGEGRGDAPRKPYARPDRDKGEGRGDAPRKPYARPDRDKGEGRGEAPRKPYARPDRDKGEGRGDAPRKPYARPDRDKGEGRGEAPRKPYARHDRDKGEGRGEAEGVRHDGKSAGPRKDFAGKGNTGKPRPAGKAGAGGKPAGRPGAKPGGAAGRGGKPGGFAGKPGGGPRKAGPRAKPKGR